LNLCCMNYLYELFVFELVFELFVFELSTHLCTASIIVFVVIFLCITINYWLEWYLTLICANIMPKFSFLLSQRAFFSAPVLIIYRAVKRFTAGYRLYRRFWFGIWIRAVNSSIPFIPLRYTLTAPQRYKCTGQWKKPWYCGDDYKLVRCSLHQNKSVKKRFVSARSYLNRKESEITKRTNIYIP
jgi:hypothetical protein